VNYNLAEDRMPACYTEFLKQARLSPWPRSRITGTPDKKGMGGGGGGPTKKQAKEKSIPQGECPGFFGISPRDHAPFKIISARF